VETKFRKAQVQVVCEQLKSTPWGENRRPPTSPKNKFTRKLPKAIFFQRYREVRSPKNIVLNLKYQRCSEFSQILNGQQRKGEWWRLKGTDHLKETANFLA
jgi:hypothetical protein